MKHTYTITGMSCDGCRGKVEKTLNAIEGVEAVVSLEPAVATITMEKHIPTTQLQEALAAAGNYSIEMSKPVAADRKNYRGASCEILLRYYKRSTRQRQSPTS